ncbi:MAG: hypothetical protein ACXABI_07795 [Candidatus Hodarchaeales archaeon]|jgi:hypothetical protein
MKTDPRYCSVCKKLLLKQNLFGYVLLTSCDNCSEIIHEDCYLEHHKRMHDLIAILIGDEAIETTAFKQ